VPGIGDTAYPQLKAAPSAKEIYEVYTPNFVELVWAEKRTREPGPRVGLLVQLKTFQRLVSRAAGKYTSVAAQK